LGLADSAHMGEAAGEGFYGLLLVKLPGDVDGFDKEGFGGGELGVGVCGAGLGHQVEGVFRAGDAADEAVGEPGVEHRVHGVNPAGGVAYWRRCKTGGLGSF